MKRFGIWTLAALAFAVVAPLQAFALPGEADEVVAQCGPPTSDVQATSQVTSGMQRSITYGKVVLRFSAAAGGWSYASATIDGHSAALKTVRATMPCVAEALDAVAKAPRTAADGRAIPAGTQEAHFGRPFLWLIAVLVLALLLALGIPATRRIMAARPAMGDRPFRRPQVRGLRFGRRLRPPPDSDHKQE